MSAAAVSFTPFSGYQPIPPTKSAFPLVNESLDEPEQEQTSFLDTIVGRHGGLRPVLAQVALVAPTDATVLICGETGTGKEVIARAIHELSPRRKRNLVKVNCAAIPAGLLESELFGHEKGAFTGALLQKKGRFELADGGTLFLDEIGSTHTIRVNVRIIAATHRDLPAMIREGKFREDLFYRLNVFPVAIPALRERREDIPLLVNHFVSKLSRQMGRQIKTIPARTLDLLTKHPWRGNVRELANFLERAVVLSQGEELKVATGEFMAASPEMTTISTFQQAERGVIMNALRAASGRIAGRGGAAERLGLKRTTLQNKMQKLSISRADYSA